MSIELWWSAKEMREMTAYDPSEEPECVYTPPTIPIPALDLTRELYAAVVRSVDDDDSASDALSKLQNRVLMACARFECATVIV